MINRVQDIIRDENKVEELKREIRLLRYVIIFLVIIVAILTVIVIGGYVSLWGGVMIKDPNLGLDMINIYR
ncbi:hypothetical protein LCGC14_0597190 [marine sediment metagenome]|uniref:Uncharacterized protein n=1 Tax=marine sediment metagenome TaxID=412755 RepID=A0A0F9TXX1_9ZZZZ